MGVKYSAHRKPQHKAPAPSYSGADIKIGVFGGKPKVGATSFVIYYIYNLFTEGLIFKNFILTL